MSGDAGTGTSTGRRTVSTRAVVVGALLVSLLLAGVVSLYAASTPDGLTKVSQDQGFADTETEHGAADGPFAGYDAGFLDGDLGGAVAGVAGVVVVLVLGTALTAVVRRRPGADEPLDQTGP